MTSDRTLDVLVVGGASLDVLHFGGRTVASAGGAGLYTAMAAHCAGAKVAMFAPRPQPVPSTLQPAVDRLLWVGPTVPPDELPHFEIAHHGGGRATLVNASWGAEAALTPDTLPPELLEASIVHVAALRSADRQLTFARICRSRSAARLSAGTYARSVSSDRDRVRELFEAVDFFFMNENEASLLFGSLEAAHARPGQVLFVTLGERGALVIQGDHVTHVPGQPVDELDPTGAGDTFCGTTLAGLASGEHPVMAARAGVALAAEMIGAVGPTRLMSDRPVPEYLLDDRCRPLPGQIRRVAGLIAGLPDARPFDFTGDLLPPVDHPHTLDYFFAATLQQFGFWVMREGRYRQPMIATLDGRRLKGSDYLWSAYRRQLDRDPDFFTLARQAVLSESELAEVFRSDDETNPMPAFDLHLQQARTYGRDMQSLGWMPASLIAEAARSGQSRAALLDLLTRVGGYKEDPLRKKAMLLTLILEQRPEQFLRPAPDDPEPPVIDYHLMRSCLRIGLIEIDDGDLLRRVIGREVLSADEEWTIRAAAYRAIQQVRHLSGRSMGAVDWFFFDARRRCPEMTDPDCPNCAVDPVCAHRKELFQPVIRTAFY